MAQVCLFAYFPVFKLIFTALSKVFYGQRLYPHNESKPQYLRDFPATIKEFNFSR